MALSRALDGMSKAGENDVAPARPHTIERVGHSSVVKIKTTVFQEHPGAITLGRKTPGEGPRLGEGVDVLRAGSGYHATAKELKLDLNALRDRVERAVSRRGRPIDDRLDVELALLVCHWYGEPVLGPN